MTGTGSDTSTTPTPRYPDVIIELPVDGDTGVIRSRVHKALASVAGHEAAEKYLVETKPLCDSPPI